VADRNLVHVQSRTYSGIQCNWKVFCDNYLDGGYHVPVAHPALAGGIDMGGYRNVMFDDASVQLCSAKNAADGATSAGSLREQLALMLTACQN
jgi:choline monooxygenase